MNKIKNLLIIILIVISFKSYSQEININYSKGNSLLFFDVNSKSNLSTSFGLSLQNKKNTFGLNYTGFDFYFDETIRSIDELPLNFKSNINSFNLSYEYELGYIDRIKFCLGINFGVSEFQIHTNLENLQGLNYEDYSFEELNSLGYYSEENFETSLSNLNLDNLNEYPSHFFSFGPSVSCSYELIENLDITFKSIFRRNSIDLLDNINSNNIRDIEFNSENDNQIDFFIGLKFNLTGAKNTAQENYKDSLKNKFLSDEILAIENEETNEIDKAFQTEKNTEITSRNEYILNLLFNDIDSGKVDDLVDDIFNDEIIVEDENMQAESEVYEDVDNDISLNKSEKFYVIVGVFSIKNNAEKLAQSLEIDINNLFFENELYYVFALETNELTEARQLRSDLDINSWIYYAK